MKLQVLLRIHGNVARVKKKKKKIKTNKRNKTKEASKEKDMIENLRSNNTAKMSIKKKSYFMAQNCPMLRN